MLLTNFTFAIGIKKPNYQQLVDFIKQQIHNGVLPAGSRMPSIRKLADALIVSRTTTETAYNILTDDGYLQSSPHRGFFVASLIPGVSIQKNTTQEEQPEKEQPNILYDFANNYIDVETFPLAIWRRHINYALRSKDLLGRYGTFQGEEELRQALADYSRNSRSVAAVPEQIVVGAGIQNLLVILASLLKSVVPSPARIALEKPGFPQAEEIFKNQGWDVSHFSLEALYKELPSLLYIAPGNPYRGQSLNSTQRQVLLHFCHKHKGYLLEDDYNGEFRYLSRPISSLQGLSDGKSIIYLGSFSRLLLPSLRISYMVLPQPLLVLYQKIGPLYNQTASTAEQLALASFIQNGELRRHVRKIRHLYDKKNMLLRENLQHVLGKKIQILANDSALHLHIAVHTSWDAQKLMEKALSHGVRVIPVPKSKEIILSIAGIHQEDIIPAVKLLQKAWQ
jgi:GntR family transcriptional regulator/MocR family aminotransferase